MYWFFVSLHCDSVIYPVTENKLADRNYITKSKEQMACTVKQKKITVAEWSMCAFFGKHLQLHFVQLQRIRLHMQSGQPIERAQLLLLYVLLHIILLIRKFRGRVIIGKLPIHQFSVSFTIPWSRPFYSGLALVLFLVGFGFGFDSCFVDGEWLTLWTLPP